MVSKCKDLTKEERIFLMTVLALYVHQQSPLPPHTVAIAERMLAKLRESGEAGASTQGTNSQ